ncbi:sugar ABC transporter substrate-binding protein [Pseudonocardia petroleophila]|uniref:Extracellular solute-binding protein n=1 Tax=Pseudonocardia petroleophila TaxID=37331 RepID=A0A7G7MHN1_9PSEU|nr:extracellular solute-binding protein [Pseudonocardia petroleophila]QNG52292.1 extracellular solute-binding protein [Pseudonocardia petroleophila]
MTTFDRRTALQLSVAALALTACSPASPSDGPAPDGVTTVTLRLWDEDVEAAYRESFDEFSRRNPDIRVEFTRVAFADYFTSLPLDVASGTATDVYWVNALNYGALADAGKLIDVGTELGDQVPGWTPAAVEQYTRNGVVCGVPVLTDGRIVLYYNKAMVEAAGVDPANLTWNPTDPAADTFLAAARRLTLDTSGRDATDPAFDAGAIAQYGHNAARDLQGIYYNFVGSNGGRIQAEDATFVYTEPATAQAFGYLVDLINRYRVAPSAADTNTNPDFSRDQFLQGRMALFESGTYNLQNVDDGAEFEWGIAPLPAGPAGRVSVVNSIIAAGNADSPRREQILRVLRWLGSPEGAVAVGARGAALPAVLDAQQGYYDYWTSRGVDTAPFGTDGGDPTIDAPFGPKYGAATTANEGVLNDVFSGRVPLADGLQQAQDVANAALR